MNAYSADLARVHHEGFDDVARNAAALVLDELRRSRGRTRLLVDLGCGTGTLASIVSDAEYDVVGVDVSDEMLRIARAHAPRARFVEASLFDYVLPECAAVTAVGEVLNYLFAGEPQLAPFFTRVHDALERGGVFVFDVCAPGRVPNGDAARYVDHGDWVVYAHSIEDREQATLSRRITTFTRDGDAWRRTDEEHRQRLFAGADVEQQLRDAGFVVRRRRGYGALAFAAGTNVFVARKP